MSSLRPPKTWWDLWAFDERPLQEQPALWAPAELVRFKLARWRLAPDAWDAPAAQAWREAVARQVERWQVEPLVWRVQDGQFQAVWRGLWRFTWSVAQSEGCFETWNASQTWAKTTPDRWFNHVDQGWSNQVWLDRIVQAIAHQAQAHQPVRQAWLSAPGLPMRWAPTDQWPESWSAAWLDRWLDRLPATHQDWMNRGALAWRQGLRALAQLDPLWRVLRASVGRQPLAEARPWLQALNDWSAWGRAAAEQPRAKLLLPHALKEGLAPNWNVWRAEVWHERGVPRSTWSVALKGPMAWVKTVVREASPESWAKLGVHHEISHRHVPAAILRRVPLAWWDAIVQKEGDVSWALARLQVFFKEVRRRPWLAQGLSMTAWMDEQRPLLMWLSDQPRCPWPDPSWSWRNVREAWMAEENVPAEWPLPCRAFTIDGVRVKPVSTHAEWRWLGAQMKNCLADGRSDHYLAKVEARGAVLVRVLDHEQTVAFLTLSTDARALHEEAPWIVDEHLGKRNTIAPDRHAKVVDRLALALNQWANPLRSAVVDPPCHDVVACACLPCWDHPHTSCPESIDVTSKEPKHAER